MSEDWSRPHWHPSGRQASLFYFVPGDPPSEGLHLKAARHHVDPQGAWQEIVDITLHERDEAPGLFASFFDPNGVGHDIGARFGAGAAPLRSAQRGTLLQANFPDPPALGFLRDTTRVVSAIRVKGGLGVLDL
jgi:hypothetical protein